MTFLLNSENCYIVSKGNVASRYSQLVTSARIPIAWPDRRVRGKQEWHHARSSRTQREPNIAGSGEEQEVKLEQQVGDQDGKQSAEQTIAFALGAEQRQQRRELGCVALATGQRPMHEARQLR